MDRYSKNRELNDKLLALFEKQQAGFNSSSIPPLNNYRAEGLARFKEIGIPNKTVEEYRYSDMTEPYKTNYVTLPSYIELKADLHKIFKCETPELNAHTALSINGWFYRENKQIGALPEGVVICSMITAYNEHREILEKHIGTAVADCNDPMVAINKMFAADGFFVYIPKGVVMENPIQLVHLTGSNKATSATQRNLIIAESCSEAKILLCDHSLAENSTLSNRLTEIAVGSSANVELYSIGNQNNSASTVNSIYVDQAADSCLKSFAVSLHGNLIRNNLKVNLNGSGAEANLYGITVSDSYQHVDNFTNTVHNSPNCSSNQIYKNVLEDSSTGSFTGQIVVKEGAKMSEAFQRNNNILLSPNAKINTKPQLVIDNDDVKCSHGATIGQIDKDALFYLQARGIGKREARLMLTFAFAHEILEKVSLAPLKENLDALVSKRLRGESSHCEGCSLDCNKNI